MDATELEKGLEGFNGTECYYQHPLGIRYTDGIQYLAKNAGGGAYWLLDIIASYQPELKAQFQVWTLVVNDDKSAVITCKKDSGQPNIVTKKIEYTDFPLKKFECYCIDGIVLLPGEY